MNPFPSDNFLENQGSIFTFGSIFFVVVFLLVIGFFIFAIVSGIRQWSYNNSQPVLTVEARIVAKRVNVSNHTHHDSNHMTTHHSSTSYYITFGVQSGDRMEFLVGSHEYGMLAEGDFGRLTFQGTRYLGFERLIL